MIVRFFVVLLAAAEACCTPTVPVPAVDCGSASLIDQDRLIRTDSGAALVLPCPDAGK